MTPRKRSQGAALAPTTPDAVVGTPKARRRKTARLNAPKKEDDSASSSRSFALVRAKAPSPAVKEEEGAIEAEQGLEVEGGLRVPKEEEADASVVKQENPEDAIDPALLAATARQRAPSPAIKTEEDSAGLFSFRFDSSRLADETLAHILSSRSLAKRDLAAVCLVSRRFRDLAQPVMYRSLTIYIVDHTGHRINEAVMTDDPSSRLLLKRTLQDVKLAGLVRSVDFQLKSQDWPLEEGDHRARRRRRRCLSDRLFVDKPKEDQNDADGMHDEWEERDFEEALAERTTMWSEVFDNIFSSFARDIERLSNLTRLDFRIGKHGDGFSKFWETVGKLQHLTRLYLDPVLDEEWDFPFRIPTASRFPSLRRLELDAAHDEEWTDSYAQGENCLKTRPSGEFPKDLVLLEKQCKERGIKLVVRPSQEWREDWEERLGESGQDGGGGEDGEDGEQRWCGTSRALRRREPGHERKRGSLLPP